MKIKRKRLTDFAVSIFVSMGTSEKHATEVATHLVEANLKGHDSHGVGLIPYYVNSWDKGGLKVNADATLEKDKGPIMLVNGNLGFGQVVGRQATDMGIERAKEIGLACVGSRNNHHLGRIGAFGEHCAKAGLISIHFVNVVGHPPVVSPWGGREARMSTNPFCCAVPTSEGPIVLDMATSAIAGGKVSVARRKGLNVPDGCLFDADGAPTNNPDDFFTGGTLGPFGQHKGYGLGLICELLGGALAGEWTIQDVDKQKNGVTVNGMLMFIVDPDLFGGQDGFEREVKGMSEWLYASQPANGFDKVRLPGEPESESMATRLTDGISIDDKSWSDIVGVAKRVGVNEKEIPT
ncbi:MAG: malate/lactate/ureidoglycolate dehydrogenase [Candidatus Poribacteria bacterium]|nr:malate/lactate/ureidoglycolate dehydrogenase [Candidatus Poribacteria bacterium]